MNNKKGIGVVVVSVFIILITVAAITITWYWVVPYTQDVEASGDTNANLRIVLEDGYTAYDVEHEMAFVQIKRGADDVDVVALDVIFNVDGNSYVFRTKDAPNNNQAWLYYFNFTEAEIVGVPQFVKVAPVFSKGVGEEIGLARGEVVIPSKRVNLDDWEVARVKAEENVLKKDIVIEDVISDPVNICKNDFSPGEVYVLDQSYSVFSNSNCFEISVDDVVLDLNGYLIVGNYSGYGVWITGDNVTVKNGRIERFEKGVFIDGTFGENDNKIVDNNFFDNNNSVYIGLSNGNYIAGNVMDSGNYSNIYLWKSTGNHVTDNWACGSLKDIYCDDSPGNYGTGNTFNSVRNCPGDVWSIDLPGSYTQCED